MPNFDHRIDYRIIFRPKHSILSLSAFSIPEPDLASQGHSTKAARLSPQVHYDKLLIKPTAPMAVTGVRNVLANLRCIAYSPAMCKQFNQHVETLATVTEEKLSSARPYHALRYAKGKYSIEEYRLGESLDGIEWLVTGIPVLWDCPDNDLFERLVTEAADHSHVWELPRGNHPEATCTTRCQWKALHDEFVATLAADRGTAAAAILKKAQQFSLTREKKYLHSVWGVTEDGALIVIIGHGKLEDLGKSAREIGAKRALCVENSGSCALYLVPEDPAQPWKLQVCGHNFRPAGTAFVFFELHDKHFAVM